MVAAASAASSMAAMVSTIEESVPIMAGEVAAFAPGIQAAT